MVANKIRSKSKVYPRYLLGVFFAFAVSFIIPLSANAATFDQSGCDQITYYKVGPGQQYTNLSELPWSQLGGCTTVQIFPKANNAPYPEQVLISAGTFLTPTAPNQWFRLQGMPDASGKLPIITGKNSTQKETVNGQVRSLQYIDNENQGRALYKESVVMLWAQKGAPWKKDTVQYVQVDHLQIQGANDTNSFTDEKNHQLTQYDDFASGIYGNGKHIIFRDNIITDNGNGLFMNSINGVDNSPGSDHQSSEDLLIQGNIFTYNGRVDDFHEHHIYVQTMGPEIVQYNFFGMGRPGSHPQAYKTRSANSIFRYNTVVFDPAQYNDPCTAGCAIQQAIWYSEPNGSPFVIKAAPGYHQAFVYGNTFVDKANSQGLIYSDREAGDKIYFFNNTYLAQRPKPNNQVLLFMNPTGVKVEARNNIFASEPSAPGILPVPLVVEGSQNLGTVNLLNNMVTTSILSYWPFHHPAGSTSTVTGFDTNIMIPNNDNSLVFNDFGNLDFHLKAGSPAIGASAALDPIAIANGLLLNEEYQSVGLSKPRANSADLGAFAFTGQGGAIIVPPSDGNQNGGGNPVGGDLTAPVLTLLQAVATPSVQTSPIFKFSSSEAGTMKFNGCPVTNPANNSVVAAGNINITFGPLAVGTYSNCSITVTDAANNISAPLAVASFTITNQQPGVVVPFISMVNAIPASTNNTSPSFTFNTTIGGVLKFNGCPVSNPANNAVVGAGNNMVVFGPLNLGSYNNCSITVTDVNNAVSNTLFIGNFQIVAGNGGNNGNNGNGGLSADGTCAGYLDVKNVDNCFMYVKMQQLGFFKPATYFYPNELIDRSQALKLSELLSHKFNPNQDYCQNNTYYPDVKKNYDWAAQLICFETQNKQVNGSKGYFEPYRKVNFAELSKMIGANTNQGVALLSAMAQAIRWYDPFINFMLMNQIVLQQDAIADHYVPRWQAVKIFYALFSKNFIQ